MAKYIGLIILCFSFSSLAFSSKSIEDKAEAEVSMSEKKSETTVKVYKADGSLQCQPDSGLSLKEMAKQLNNITAISHERKHDGKMRMTLCGTPTGYMNVYEINESQLEKALEYGFKKL